MIILGIDPGIAIVGWGVVDFENNRFRTVDFGAIRTKAGTDTVDRLDHALLREEEGMQIIDLQNVAVITHLGQEFFFLGLAVFVSFQPLHLLGICLGDGFDRFDADIGTETSDTRKIIGHG